MDNMENIEENYKKLDINREETIRQFDGMYVDFYLEDDMFEVEGQFFYDRRPALHRSPRCGNAHS